MKSVSASAFVSSLMAILSISGTVMAQTKTAKDFSSAKDWNLKAENILPRGVNPWHDPLIPGHKIIMEKPDHPDGYYRKEIIVLDKTEKFDVPGIGKFETAIVQEEEFLDGVYTQQALNWYAIDKVNNNVYTFGELSWEIDENGNKIFDGSWRVGDPDGNGVAEAGMLMPGTPLVGARYIFDGMESEAYGGAEVMETGLTETGPAGTFKECAKIREYNLRDPDDITDKIWCPGVGIVFDTSDGKLIASDALATTDTSSFGKYHREPKKQVVPPVAKVTGEQATKIALKQVHGEARSVSIERKLGKNVYVVEVVGKDGGEKDVFVDIETGEVVGTD
jgi:uncharacterized membrane protein YkoI